MPLELAVLVQLLVPKIDDVLLTNSNDFATTLSHGQPTIPGDAVMFRSLTKALALVVTMTLGTGLCAAEPKQGAAERLTSLFGGKEAQDVVAKPTKVQAYRLEENSTFKSTVKEYKMIAGPVAVDDKLAKSLSELLLNEKSYLWEVGKACDPLFGVRLEFLQGDKSTDVFFCFECDILDVYVNGKSVGSEDFDHMRPELVKAMQKIFSEDKVIQGLKEKR